MAVELRRVPVRPRAPLQRLRPGAFPARLFAITRTCSQCHGTGQLIKNRCHGCHGEGRVIRERTLDLKIPAGVDTGSKMRVTGEGDAGGKGFPWRSNVFLNVQEHEFSNAANTISIATFQSHFLKPRWGRNHGSHSRTRGREAVDSGRHSTASTFRIKGRGISKRGGSARGDLYVTVDVTVPAKLNRDRRNC